jgi:hypothetical protein
MDIVSDPAFWGDIGLVAASRLAVLATALWIVRLAVRGWTPRPAPTREARSQPPPRAASAPLRRPPERAASAPRYVDLRPSRPSAPASVSIRGETETRRDHLRNRLMEYLDQRATERTQS